LNSYGKALEFAEAALQIEPNNVKCLGRKAKASAHLGHFTTSLSTFEALKSKGIKCDKDIREVNNLIEFSKDDE